MNVLVVGAGAIGGPLVLALDAESDIGLVRVCDDDRVEASNLQRQVQFTTADIGAGKAERLAERAGNRVEAAAIRFDPDTASELLDGVDLVIDGSDNFATKFFVNDEARARGLPAIIASAIGTRGQLFVAQRGGACYRCLFESEPERETGTCAQVGVLAPMPGLVAGHAALAAVALANGQPAAPLTVFPDPATEPRTTTFEPREGCSACSNWRARETTTNSERSDTHGNSRNPRATA